MSITDTEKIDYIGLDHRTGDVILVITDHLDWCEPVDEHLLLLQEKLNTYLRFVESGEVYSHVPLSTIGQIRFRLIGKHPLSDAAMKVFLLAKTLIAEAGFSLSFEQFDLEKSTT